jgi:hypothetical protein
MCHRKDLRSYKFPLSSEYFDSQTGSWKLKITNDASDYINLLVRIAHIICNHRLYKVCYYPSEVGCEEGSAWKRCRVVSGGSHEKSSGKLSGCATRGIATFQLVTVYRREILCFPLMEGRKQIQDVRGQSSEENIWTSEKWRTNRIAKIMTVYPKVSGLTSWSGNYKWYNYLPLDAVVSLFCESV